MEGMLKPVEIRFCNQTEANELLSKGDEMWQPHGEPFVVDSTIKVALIRMIPIRFNVRNDAPSILVPQVRPN